MAWQYHPLLLLFAFGGLVSLLIAGYCAWYMKRYGRRILVSSIGLLGLNNAIWVFAAMLKTGSTGLDTSLLFYKIEFVGVLTNSVVAVAFALIYVGRDQWLSRRVLALMSMIPVGFLALIIGNPGNIMIIDPTFIETQGILAFEHKFPPLFVVMVAWIYGAILVAVLTIGWGFAAGRVPATPALVGIIVLSLPLAAGVLKTAHIYPPGGKGINVAPAASAIGISIFAIAVMWFRVFELIPIGRERAIESMTDGYILVGPDEMIRDANSAAAEMLGNSVETSLDHEPADEILPIYGELTEANPIDFEIDGHILEATCTDVNGENYNSGEVILMRDVTEDRERKRKLERANERLDQFASTVSHDLRNPLNVAQGNLELAQAESESDYLTSIENAHERMETLIEDLLGLARAGESIDELEPVDLSSVVEGCWRNVETEGATLVSNTEKSILADKSRLQQLLENLFRNSMEHGGSDVTVTVGDMPDGFYVADDGPGISADVRSEIFNNRESDNNESPGLGVMIVQEIAKGHSWDIDITESEAGGARFEITNVEPVN